MYINRNSNKLGIIGPSIGYDFEIGISFVNSDQSTNAKGLPGQKASKTLEKEGR